MSHSEFCIPNSWIGYLLLQSCFFRPILKLYILIHLDTGITKQNPKSFCFLLLHSHTEINYLGKENGTSWMCTFFANAEEWCLLPFLQFCKKLRLIGSFSARCNRTARFLLCEYCHCIEYAAYINRLMMLPSGSQFYVSISNNHVCLCWVWCMCAHLWFVFFFFLPLFFKHKHVSIFLWRFWYLVFL